MRVLIARCKVVYSGRLDTTLAPAVRAILIKADGSVAVHTDAALAAKNWMVRPTRVYVPPLARASRRRPVTWTFATSRETLAITISEVLADTEHALEAADPGLVKRGTERDLQAWLARHPDTLGEGHVLLAREHPTGAGPVDLMVLGPDGIPVAVEVKRVASLGAVDQVSRYVEALTADGSECRGMIAAFDVRPRARDLALSRGFAWVEIDKESFLADLSAGR